jgi:hypothetical protein
MSPTLIGDDPGIQEIHSQEMDCRVKPGIDVLARIRAPAGSS